MRTPFDLLLGLVDRVLQVVVPPVADRIGYISTPDYTDNAFYVFRHAVRTRDGLEHVWLINDLALRERVEREFAALVEESGHRGHRLRVETRASLRGYLRFLRCRYVFHTHGAYRFRSWAWRRHIVCLWHGMPIKCIGRLNRVTPNPYATFGTLHIATSEFFRPIIATAFGVAATAVRLCSLPRCDALNDRAAAATAAARVKERLRVAAEQRLVLWLPTYRAEGAKAAMAGPRSFLDDLPAGTLAALDAAAAQNGCTVLTKLHPMDPLNDARPQWPAARIRLMTAQEWAASGLQLYDVLAASDALISDVSSVLIDYLVTGRRIGILGFDEATYTRELTFPFARLLDTGRFHLLGDPAGYEPFLRLAHPPSRPPAPTFLYDAFPLPGSEQILREVGL